MRTRDHKGGPEEHSRPVCSFCASPRVEFMTIFIALKAAVSRVQSLVFSVFVSASLQEVAATDYFYSSATLIATQGSMNAILQ